MGVSIETFRKVALEDDEGVWEYHCGRLVRKPPMTMEHNYQAAELARQLNMQLDPDAFRVSQNAGHLETGGHYMVPDVSVIPAAYQDRLAGSHVLEEYADPLPFVAEVWSRSTGDYDVEVKLPDYRLRGDLEIWRVHPYEKTVIAWRRQADGSYTESRYESGTVAIGSLQGVTIDLAQLFRY